LDSSSEAAEMVVSEAVSDFSAAVQTLEALTQALTLADPQEIAAQLEAVRHHIETDALVDLENQINDYDYKKALHTAQAIQAGLGAGATRLNRR
jgi:lysyl-tRNA synthetase class II